MDRLAGEVQWVIDKVKPLRNIMVVRLLPAQEESTSFLAILDTVTPKGRVAEILVAGPECTGAPGEKVVIGKTMGMEEMVEEIITLSEDDAEAIIP